MSFLRVLSLIIEDLNRLIDRIVKAGGTIWVGINGGNSPFYQNLIGREIFDRPEFLRCRAALDGGRRGRFRQTLTRREGQESRAILAIDASLPMQPHLPVVESSLAEVAHDRVAGVVVGDDLPIFHANVDDGLADLGRPRPSAGYDGALLLATALRSAVEHGADTVVWLHAGQPVHLSKGAALNAALLVGSNVRILDMNLSRDVNVVANTLQGKKRRQRRWLAGSDLPDRLALTWKELRGEIPEFVRDIEALPAAADPELPEAASDVARLWASREVQRIMRSDHSTAVDLATRYRLVTPVTSAVCLETDKQYDEFGLEKAGADSLPELEMPTIPEPETWILIITGLLGATIVFLRSRAAG